MEFIIDETRHMTFYNYFSFFKDIDKNNIEKYYMYLCDLIDEANAVILSDNSVYTKIGLIKKEYDKIFNTRNGIKQESNNRCIYYFNDTLDKEKIMNILTYNITDETGKQIQINIDSKYLGKEDSNINEYLYLLKDNRIIAFINLYTSSVCDMRDWNDIRKQKSIRSNLRYDPKIKEIGLYRKKGKEYRYSTLINSIKVDYNNFIDQDRELLSLNHSNEDEGKLEKCLDIFRDYLFDLIDGCDHFIVEELNMREFFHYKEYLKYEFYDSIIYKGTDYSLNSCHIFDISNNEYKEILKNIIIFNIENTNGEFIKLNVNSKYIHNDENDFYDGNSIYFIKDDKVLFEIETYSGNVIDYRDLDVIEKHQNKYRELSKKL